MAQRRMVLWEVLQDMQKAYLIDNTVITQNGGVGPDSGERICRRDRRSHDLERHL
ncbi:MAG: hypothetical protein ACLUD2_07585 [Clostridium sp.]